MTNKNVTEFKVKKEEKITKEDAKKAIKVILKYIGENPEREGFVSLAAEFFRTHRFIACTRTGGEAGSLENPPEVDA